MRNLASAAMYRWLVVSLLTLLPGANVAAQQSVRRTLPPLELRVDAIDVRSTERGTLQAGVGANVPLGYYVRLEMIGAGGITRSGDVDDSSGRVDVLARFLLDPFAESSWGISIGGGMSAMFTENARAKEYLVVVADLEGPRIGMVVPALQIGLGGGVRVGVGARAFQTARR
jgi:hypothetical protein